MDNRVTGRRANPAFAEKSDVPVAQTGEGATPGSDSAGDAPLTGSDLARQALRAAQASAAARGKGRSGGAGRGGNSLARRRRRWSGPRPDERDPQPLGRLAARIAADRGWVDRLAGGQVFARWPSLVGADVAEHTKPVALANGELTVQADSTAWATQLRLLQRQLLARIARGVGDGVVRRLKVHGPTAPSWRHGPRHIPGRGPRDTYG